MIAAPRISKEFLAANYETIFFDAFGVLMDANGALPGAIEYLDYLIAKGRQFFILSNGSLYSDRVSHQKCLERGFDFPELNYISSGGLIEDWVSDNGYGDANFMVLGPDTSYDLVKAAGGKIIDFSARQHVDVIVLAHQSGFDFVRGMDAAITVIFAAQQRGERIPILCPNTDIIYPNRNGEFGITAGSMIAILQKAFFLRFPDAELPLVFLGKPHAPIFAEGMRRSGNPDKGTVVMIGDQLHTDIKGANDFGIDSVLIGTGITSLDFSQNAHDVLPNYVLPNFDD